MPVETNMRNQWVVKSLSEKDDEGEPLYWNNQLGWGSRNMATIFYTQQACIDDSVNEEVTGVETRICVMPSIMECWEHLYQLYADYNDLDDEQIRECRADISNHIEDAMQWLNLACQITDDDVQEYTGD
jgi:hypothetical protein